MKTMADIEHLSSIHPVIDFCLMQIKAGNISEHDALIEMLMHVGEALRENQDEIKRLKARIIEPAQDVELFKLITEFQNIEQTDSAAAASPEMPIERSIEMPIASIDPEPKIHDEPGIEHVEITASIDPVISDRIKKLDMDTELTPRRLETKKKLGRGWKW